MGDDPRTSPLNKFSQAHEVKNLFVADGVGLVRQQPGQEPDAHGSSRSPGGRPEYFAEEMRRGNV